MSNQRSSNWLFCMYPESMPDDWRDIIESKMVSCCISPLHDQDVNPTGEPKKPHYHVLIKFDTLKSESQVVSLLTEKLNATKPIICHSVRGAVRYFSHMDNPEKHQYDPNDMQVINGFDPSEINKPTEAQVYEMTKKIIQYINDNQICYYWDLLMMTLFDPSIDPQWGFTVTHNTMLFSGACKSLYQKLRG